MSADAEPVGRQRRLDQHAIAEGARRRQGEAARAARSSEPTHADHQLAGWLHHDTFVRLQTFGLTVVCRMHGIK